MLPTAVSVNITTNDHRRQGGPIQTVTPGPEQAVVLNPVLGVSPVIYTTNSIEALHRQTRKIIKTRGHFPTEEAVRKLIYLAISKAETRWRQVLHWQTALAAFKIQFPDRIPDNDI